MGAATEPTVTVVATPDPDGPPIKKEDSTIVRPTPEDLPPIAAKEKSMKNFPAPVNCKKAPKIVNKIIKVADTSMAVP